MDDSPRPLRPGTDTHLFTIRLWQEEVGTPATPQTEWRGQVQHPLSGAVRYFRDWAALLTQLQHLTGDVAGGAAVAPAGPATAPVAPHGQHPPL